MPNNLCHLLVPLAQLRVFFFDEKKLEKTCVHSQEIIKRSFWPVIFDSSLSKLMEYWSVAQNAPIQKASLGLFFTILRIQTINFQNNPT